MAFLIKDISQHGFFISKVAFGNGRMQHREVAAKLLFLEESLRDHKKIIDTKKPYLDDMVKRYKDQKDSDLDRLRGQVTATLDFMTKVFEDSDRQLRTQTPIPIVFLLVRDALEEHAERQITRRRLAEFYFAVAKNREMAEEDITKANYEMLEFDRLSQQGTNDSTSIKERVRILKEFLNIPST